jgi:hypothetical protein
MAATAIFALLAATLISRPLWMTGHHTPPNSGYDRLVAGLQAHEGLAIDATRSYDEQSATWLSWYFGWPMVVLGFAGLALIARRALRHRDPRYLTLLAVIAAPSALYLWRVNIAVDQVWAIRRFLPVTIPGFLLAATLSIVALWSVRRWWTRASAGLLVAAIAVFPIFTWGSLFTTSEQGGRWAEIKAVCAGIKGEHVLYIRAGGPAYLATLRSVCDVEVVEVRHVPSAKELISIRNTWGGRDLSVVAFSAEAVRGSDGAAPPPLMTTAVTGWSNALSSLPREPTLSASSVWVGLIQQDGTVIPMAPLDKR